MITLYDSRETDFTHNGIHVLDACISCVATEVANGDYYLELEYPTFGNNKWEGLIEENIIKAPTPKYGEQLFRISRKQLSGNSIQVFARHIFYDLLDNFLEDVRPTDQNGAGAISWILQGTNFPHKFKGFSDISKISTANYIRKNPVQALISDDDNSFLNRWGGELERDNFNIKFYTLAGEDRGTTISYGKNLLSVEENLDTSSVVTRLMLTGLKADDTVLMLPEKYIDSSIINTYPNPKIQHIHYSDLKVDEENGITEAIVFQELRNQASRLYSLDKIDYPKVNYSVDFIELTKTEEYKNYKVLEQLYLYDKVTIKHERLGIHIKATVIRYNYDCLTKKYTSIELGNFKGDITRSLSNVEKTLVKVSEEITRDKSEWKEAVDNATDLITNALGGYVLKRNGEILIMDKEDPMEAKKIWRWNVRGLGYSQDGINGPFATAITMDGKIIAEFIYGLTVQGEQIIGGTIEGVNIKTSNAKERILISKSTIDCFIDDKKLMRVGTSIDELNAIIPAVTYGLNCDKMLDTEVYNYITAMPNDWSANDAYAQEQIGLHISGGRSVNIDVAYGSKAEYKSVNIARLTPKLRLGGYDTDIEIGAVSQQYNSTTKVHIEPGIVVNAEWSATIPSGTSVRIDHNLKHIPIVQFSGTLGNLSLNVNHINENSLEVSNYSTGDNTWQGKIYLW